MKIAIMQPTYLPWIGYFDLMDQVDAFIFLDDIEFSKQSWQQRNRIKTNQGELWLTVPVKNKNKTQLIKEIRIDNNQKWQKKQFKTIELNYKKSQHFNKYKCFLEKLYCSENDNLTELNIKLILWVKEKLMLNCKIIKSSELELGKGNKVERLIKICQKFKSDEYLSPLGSKEYIEKNNLFEKHGIKLKYQNFVHPEYTQLFGDFLPYMCILDLLFNEGEKAIEIIRSGRKE